MAEPSPQTLANHMKIDPPFHYFILPVFAISWIVSVIFVVRHPNFLHVWVVIFNSALIVAVIRFRQYALKVQDRVIRLEEAAAARRVVAGFSTPANPEAHRTPTHRVTLCLRRRITDARRTESLVEFGSGGYQEGDQDLAT
jgi:hypothetical protein